MFSIQTIGHHDRSDRTVTGPVRLRLPNFGDFFGKFELYMPNLTEEETSNDPGPDINTLLSLSVNENVQKLSPVFSSSPPNSACRTPFLELQNYGLQSPTQHTDSKLQLNTELKAEIIKSERLKKLTANELEEV